MHYVIVIPGLGDNVKLTVWATKYWRAHGLEPVVFPMEWYNQNVQLADKFKALLNQIDRLTAQGERVSLVGCSAGASAAFNAFYERRNVVNKVISVCGRLKTGSQKGFRSLEKRSECSPSFAESVRLFESRESLLSQQDKKRIMTIRPLFGDELVPADTAILPGACNVAIPAIEHSLSIYIILRLLPIWRKLRFL